MLRFSTRRDWEHGPSLKTPASRRFSPRTPTTARDPRPLAVFDCDGTVIQGDIGESMFYRQIRHFHFRRSPAEVWKDHPRRPSSGGCMISWPPSPARHGGQPRLRPPFAEILLGWYFDQIASGAVTKACADIVRLFAGYTPAEVRSLARETCDEEFSSPFGTFCSAAADLPGAPGSSASPWT